MKVSLVVAAGSHEGRQIPLTGPQFLIGRDPQCQLRPASQAISKLHCAVLVRDGKVYVRDYGSTNGTLVNDALVQDAEIAIEDGATLRVGPLDFIVKIELLAAKPDGTPLPSETGESAAAMAAVKAVAGAGPQTPSRDPTPALGRAAKPDSKPGVAKKPSGSKPAPVPAPGEGPLTSESVSDDDHDRIAAMLLGMDDEGNGSVPDGSTVMDMPNPLGAEPGKADDKKKDDKPKQAQTREEMSTAASDLLRQYMRRPK